MAVGHKAIAPNASTTRSNTIERLVSDKGWLDSYRVSKDEVESLSNIALMGELKSEKDVLFILNQIRRARLRCS